MTLRPNDYDRNGDIIPDSVMEEEVRLIDANELKNNRPELRNTKQEGHQSYNQGWNNAISDFLDLIDNAPTVTVDNYAMGYQDGIRKVLSERPKGEWIPVSERLPEPLTEVLVTSTNGHVYTSRIVHGEFEYGGNITAWQPLPEPYKEGGADMRGEGK